MPAFQEISVLHVVLDQRVGYYSTLSITSLWMASISPKSKEASSREKILQFWLSLFVDLIILKGQFGPFHVQSSFGHVGTV